MACLGAVGFCGLVGRLNPKPLNPKTINPKTLNPKPWCSRIGLRGHVFVFGTRSIFVKLLQRFAEEYWVLVGFNFTHFLLT